MYEPGAGGSCRPEDLPTCHKENINPFLSKREDLLSLWHGSQNPWEMINWIIEFEQTIKNLLFTKSELWFHNELDLDDIEYFFNSSIRTYKENLQVMRTYILSSKHLNNTSLQIYDENESIKHLKDVLNKSIKAIICFKGVKFTSTSFQLDIDIKQILIIEQKQIFNK